MKEEVKEVIIEASKPEENLKTVTQNKGKPFGGRQANRD